MLSVFIPLLLLASSPAASPQPAPAQAAPAVKVNPLEKIICRTEDPSGGRLNKQRVCMSVRDWQDQAQENREATERLQLMGQNVPR
jgi:hypothetical protein